MNSSASDSHPLDQENDLDATPLQENDIVGEYRIECVVGRGGFGTVYRAAHPLIGKVVAIKVLKRQFSSRRETVSRFVAEARAVNKIQHRNIIDIFSFGRIDDGRHYYVMEYLKGSTMGDALARRGAFPVAETLMIFDQLGRALAAANAHGIVHRDLKPDNIFLVDGDDGSTTVKLLDFGIAKLLDPLGLGNETQAGSTMGTPAYMSPEQINDKPCDQRSDVYAFGILFFEVLAGAPPFVGESPMATLAMQVRDTPPLLSSRAPRVGTVFDAVIARMLDKDPERRPATALVALEEIFAAADQGGIALATSLARSSSRDWSSYLSVRLPEHTPTSPHRSARSLSLRSPSMSSAPRLVAPDVDTLPEGIPAGGRAPSAAPGAVSGPSAAPARGGSAVKILGAVAALALAAAIAWRGTSGAPAPVAASAPPPPTAAAAASAPSSVHLVVSSDPTAATVVLDGVEIGHTPLTTTIARDERSHDLVVSAPGFVPRRTQLLANRDLDISSSLSAEAPGAKPTVEAVSQRGPAKPAPREAPARVEPTTPAPTQTGLGAPGKPTARPLDGRDPWK